jgi:hypothetical protein
MKILLTAIISIIHVSLCRYYFLKIANVARDYLYELFYIKIM